MIQCRAGDDPKDDFSLSQAVLLALTHLRLPLLPFPQAFDGLLDQGGTVLGYTTQIVSPSFDRNVVTILIDKETHEVVFGILINPRHLASSTGWPHATICSDFTPQSFRVNHVDFLLCHDGSSLAVTVLQLSGSSNPIEAIQERFTHLIATADHVVSDIDRFLVHRRVSRQQRWPSRRLLTSVCDRFVEPFADERGGDGRLE